MIKNFIIYVVFFIFFIISRLGFSASNTILFHLTSGYLSQPSFLDTTLSSDSLFLTKGKYSYVFPNGSQNDTYFNDGQTWHKYDYKITPATIDAADLFPSNQNNPDIVAYSVNINKGFIYSIFKNEKWGPVNVVSSPPQSFYSSLKPKMKCLNGVCLTYTPTVETLNPNNVNTTILRITEDSKSKLVSLSNYLSYLGELVVFDSSFYLLGYKGTGTAYGKENLVLLKSSDGVNWQVDLTFPTGIQVGFYANPAQLLSTQNYIAVVNSPDFTTQVWFKKNTLNEGWKKFSINEASPNSLMVNGIIWMGMGFEQNRCPTYYFNLNNQGIGPQPINNEPNGCKMIISSSKNDTKKLLAWAFSETGKILFYMLSPENNGYKEIDSTGSEAEPLDMTYYDNRGDNPEIYYTGNGSLYHYLTTWTTQKIPGADTFFQISKKISNSNNSYLNTWFYKCY